MNILNGLFLSIVSYMFFISVVIFVLFIILTIANFMESNNSIVASSKEAVRFIITELDDMILFSASILIPLLFIGAML